MTKYKYIFVVLVYKNTDVLDGFFDSINDIDSCKVVIVDSFFDNETREKCRRKAWENDSDFLCVPNKGYGAGNNEGIQYVLTHYSFDFIIVSNSDIIVRQLDALDQFSDKECIIAPETVMLTGKRQNPSQINVPILYMSYYFLTKWGYGHDIRFFITLSHAITRFMKILFYTYCWLFRIKIARIFAAHGSFFAITNMAVKKLHPLFNNDMFLYNEETYLAFKAKKMGVPIYYCKDIFVNHLEGASSTANHWAQWDFYKKSAAIFVKAMESGEIGWFQK